MRKVNGEQEQEEYLDENPEEEYEECNEEDEEEEYGNEESFSAALRYPRRSDADSSFVDAEEDSQHIEQYYVGHSVDRGDHTPTGADMSWNSNRRR